MSKDFHEILQGYQRFRKKYALGDTAVMQNLAREGQKPRTMVVSCCDSRVDPALILQCAPGDLFVIRNVANIVPPYEKDEAHHGTSAALEFGICFLNVEHLILLGHSQCAGIQTLLNTPQLPPNDFIMKWVSLIHKEESPKTNGDTYAKRALQQSYSNCLTFPWIGKRMAKKKLEIHLWFFDVEKGEISVYSETENTYRPLVV